MHGKKVGELEQAIEDAIISVFERTKEAPPPKQEIAHLMAKAAVAVYEASARPPKRR